MLKKIIIKNINSIDYCEIDFKKGSYKFNENNVIGDIVNPIALYGHNGSGKTSVLTAMSYLIRLMIEPVETLVPFIVNNFKFDKYKNQRNKKIDLVTGSVNLSFDLDNVNYEYYIETTSLRYISKEYLKERNEVIFDRNDRMYKYNNEESQLNNIFSLVPVLRLIASNNINDVIIQKIYSYISSFTFVNLPYINRGAFVTSKMFLNMSYYDLLVKNSNEVKEILKGYNEFPIYSIEKKDNLNISADPGAQYVLKIEGENFNGELPFNMISAGMKNQSILLSILLSVPNNSVIFVDELEQALHPSAIKSFLEVVQMKKIQFVFSSHNTYILQMLRPDQIYFAKWEEGYSKYCRLSKIYPNIREINNVEKMYLSSVFDEAIKNGK